MDSIDFLIYELDRKFNLVKDASSQDFLLELIQFLDFILEDERLKPHVDQLIHNFQERVGDYETTIEKQMEELILIRRELALQFPAIDDSDLLPQLASEDIVSSYYTDPYYKSLAFFDSIIRGERHNMPIVWSLNDQLDQPDPTRLYRLIKLLLGKAYSIQRDQIPKELALKLEYFLGSHEHSRKEFLNYCRVSPEASLLRLLQFKDRANPPPKPHKTWSEKISSWMDDFSEHIARVGDENKSRNYYVTHLRRIYEEIRAAVIMTIPTPIQLPLDYNREQLYENMIKHFNMNELEELCFLLGIDHENLDRNVKKNLIRELIMWCERQNRLDELLERCSKLRPDVQW